MLCPHWVFKRCPCHFALVQRQKQRHCHWEICSWLCFNGAQESADQTFWHVRNSSNRPVLPPVYCTDNDARWNLAWPLNASCGSKMGYKRTMYSTWYKEKTILYLNFSYITERRFKARPPLLAITPTMNNETRSIGSTAYFTIEAYPWNSSDCSFQVNQIHFQLPHEANVCPINGLFFTVYAEP